MGNSAAKELAIKEADEIKILVTRKCNSYVVGVENTTVVVNVELTDLKQELSELILPFQDRPYRSEVGLLQMSGIIEDLERHANCHKHAIYVMLQILNECQSNFEGITSARMDIRRRDEIVSDTAVSNELRLEVEKVLVAYEEEARESGCWDELVVQRRDELERMLFKLGDSIIIQVQENIVNEYKNNAFEQIDTILVSEMCDGTFADPESARSLLQSFVTVCSMTREALDELPFLHRVPIERAQDKLSEHVEDLIRRIQMVYAYNFNPAAMTLVIDLDGESDSSGDSDDEDSEVTSDEEEDSEDLSSETEEEDVVAPSKVAVKSTKKATPLKSAKATPAKSKALTPAKAAKAKKATPVVKKTVEKTPKARASRAKAKSPEPAEGVAGKRKRKPSTKYQDDDETPSKANGTPAATKKSRK
jgi:hypothetical protein